MAESTSQSAQPEELRLNGKPIQPGDAIDNYIFEQEIGSGGMARVLRVRNDAGELLALKVLRRSRIETGLPRFKREFYALSRLQHPNVIRVHHLGDFEGHHYIAMEYVNGPDLHTVIRDFRSLEDQRRYARCEQILIDLCRGLAAIHRRGFVHRDLKPSNILVAPDGTCKITDFGIVKDLDPSNNPNLSTTLVGTWAYTSPEHITGRPVDHRSDLYSLGIILFAMLTGKRPFVADTMAGYLELHRARRAPRASRLRPGVPAHLDDICARLLEKAPRDRFQSAQEVLYRLEAEDESEVSFEGDSWEPPLVGTGEEAANTLEDAVNALTDRRGGWVRILGDDGAGKSRVLGRALDRARTLGLPFHHHVFVEQAPVFSIAVRLGRELLREVGEDAAPELHRILFAYAEGSSLRGDTRYALYDAIQDALATALQERPRVILLDDAHLAPGPELHLFHYLVRTLVIGEELPLLIVSTERPPPPTMVRDDDIAPSVDVFLAPLSDQDLVMLVTTLVGVGRAAKTLAQRLHSETEGNPFFATEFLRSLIARGLIRRTRNGWQLAVDPEELAHGHLEVPPGIRQMLRRRLEGIEHDHRQVLEVLAVAGADLSFDAVQHVASSLSEDDILDALDLLIREGLVRERRIDDALSYELTHRKLAEILRQDLEHNERKDLHRRLATALEGEGGQDPERMEILGHHYRQAGDAARAYRCLVNAARRLVDRSMPQEAWQLITRAKEVEAAAQAAMSPDHWAELRREDLYVRGSAAYNRGDWATSLKAREDLVVLCLDDEDERGAAEARIELSIVLRRLGRFERCRKEASDALAAARQLHDRRLVAEALQSLSLLCWVEGDLEGCERLAQEGLLVAEGVQLARQRAQLLMCQTISQATRGQLASAVRGLSEAEKLFGELRMKRPQVIALANLAETLLWQGDTEEALRRATTGATIADELGFTVGRVGAQRARGAALLELGRFDEAQIALTTAMDAARRVEMHEEVVAIGCYLLQLAMERSDPRSARHHGRLALEAAAQRDPERYLPMIQAMLARVLAPSDPVAALRLIQAATNALDDLPVPRAMMVRVALGWAWVLLGHPNRAREHAEAVVAAKNARSFRLLQLEARALLVATTSGDEASRHKRLAGEQRRDVNDTLTRLIGGATPRRRAFYEYLA